MPEFGGAGARVTRAGLPECNPIPSALIGVLIVLWFMSAEVEEQFAIQTRVDVVTSLKT